MKMVNGSFVKERESLSCCDWFSMKLHEMMFRIKTLAEEFFEEISKPLTSKDLAFVTIRYDDIYDCHDTKLRSHDLEKSGKTSNISFEDYYLHKVAQI